MDKNNNGYEYRKSTITHHQGELPRPVMVVVTAGVPKERIKKQPEGPLASGAFHAAIGSFDMHELAVHSGLAQSAMKIVFEWQPVPKPTGNPTLVASKGTVFWVEKVA